MKQFFQRFFGKNLENMIFLDILRSDIAANPKIFFKKKLNALFFPPKNSHFFWGGGEVLGSSEKKGSFLTLF